MVETISKLTLKGRFDSFKAQKVKLWLKEEIEGMAAIDVSPNILVDMHDVTFIDSAGLAALVVGIKQAIAHGGTLHLYGMQKTVQVIFELSWLDKSFPIFESEIDAKRAFGQS